MMYTVAKWRLGHSHQSKGSYTRRWHCLDPLRERLACHTWHLWCPTVEIPLPTSRMASASHHCALSKSQGRNRVAYHHRQWRLGGKGFLCLFLEVVSWGRPRMGWSKGQIFPRGPRTAPHLLRVSEHHGEHGTFEL